MVWNCAASPLYKAVERNNSTAPQLKCGSTPPPCGQPAATCQSEKQPQQKCRAATECSQPTPCPKHCCEAPPKCVHNCGKNGSQLQTLFQDRDFLLLAAVMLMLLHEKADTKLILALAFVIFS